MIYQNPNSKRLNISMITTTRTDQTGFQLTWQALMWRLLVTILLLLALAGFGLTRLDSITSQPDTHVLPVLSQESTGSP
jgi:hypothetical protein